MTIHFVRHAESVANAGGVTMENASIPLSAQGAAQADALAARLLGSGLVPSQVLVSPFLRARETARPFCERTGRLAVVNPLLHEFETFDAGLLVGLTGAERRPLTEAYWARSDPEARMGPGAETFLEFGDRVSAFMQVLPSLPDAGVVFGHGMWMALLFWKMLGFDADSPAGMAGFRKFQVGLPLPNCAAYRVDGAPGRWAWRVEQQVMRQMLADGAHRA